MQGDKVALSSAHWQVKERESAEKEYLLLTTLDHRSCLFTFHWQELVIWPHLDARGLENVVHLLVQEEEMDLMSIQPVPAMNYTLS